MPCETLTGKALTHVEEYKKNIKDKVRSEVLGEVSTLNVSDLVLQINTAVPLVTHSATLQLRHVQLQTTFQLL